LFEPLGLHILYLIINMASRRERGPRGPPSNAGGKGFQGFHNPFNRGKNEGSGRLRLSRNALRQELVREGRSKGAYDAVSTRIEDKEVDNWGAMFEFDPDLAEAFDKNMRVSFSSVQHSQTNTSSALLRITGLKCKSRKHHRQAQLSCGVHDWF
jgi:hypothetical protein